MNEDLSSKRKANMRTLLRHTRAEAAHDLGETLATIHPDALFEDQPLNLVLHGRAEAALHYRTWWDAFGIQTEDGALHWINDDLVIGEAHFAGEHKGAFLDIAPTGRRIRFPFVVVVRFRDELLSGERFYYDLNGIMTQLGRDPARD